MAREFIVPAGAAKASSTVPRRRWNRVARNYRAAAFLALAAAVITGCGAAAGGASSGGYGSGGYGGSTGSTGSGGQPAAGSAGAAGMAISTHQVAGLGSVLVDSSGKTIYTPDQESGGRIVCTGSCLNFWFPVTTQSSTPPAPNGLAGAIGTIHRTDNGKTQLTYHGKPLYTFRLDQSAGQSQGNNFTDSFGSTKFTWRAVTTGTAAAGSGAGPGSAGGSQSSPAQSGGYGGYGGY